MATTVLPDPKVNQARKDQLGHRGHKAKSVLKGQPEPMVLQVLPVVTVRFQWSSRIRRT